MNAETEKNSESERVALAREMLEMLKAHTNPSAGTQGVPPRELRLSAHDVHELADGAARLIAATNGVQLNGRPVGQKREGA